MTDFATHGDINGLTKLEVILALEEFIEKKGLRKEALAKLDTVAEESNKLVCELCNESDGEVIEIDGSFYCEPSCVEDETIGIDD